MFTYYTKVYDVNLDTDFESVVEVNGYLMPNDLKKLMEKAGRDYLRHAYKKLEGIETEFDFLEEFVCTMQTNTNRLIITIEMWDEGSRVDVPMFYLKKERNANA